MFIYERVKIDSKKAKQLQAEGWKIILTDVYNGYITFKNKI